MNTTKLSKIFFYGCLLFSLHISRVSYADEVRNQSENIKEPSARYGASEVIAKAEQAQQRVDVLNALINMARKLQDASLNAKREAESRQAEQDAALIEWRTAFEKARLEDAQRIIDPSADRAEVFLPDRALADTHVIVKVSKKNNIVGQYSVRTSPSGSKSEQWYSVDDRGELRPVTQ